MYIEHVAIICRPFILNALARPPGTSIVCTWHVMYAMCYYRNCKRVPPQTPDSPLILMLMKQTDVKGDLSHQIKIATRWGTSVSLYGVIGYHVTF